MVGEGRIERGEEFAHRRLEGGEDGVDLVEAVFNRRTEVIRRSASTDGDATVGGALAVDDEVAIVGEGGHCRKPVLIPEGLWQWGRGDHERIDRGDVTAMTGKSRGVALGSANHVTCTNGAAHRDYLG